MTTLNRFRWPAVALFIVVGAAIYANALDVPFYFDDTQNIRENPHIRVTGLGVDQIATAAIESHIPRRPVANLSFALNYYLHGYRVAGYHGVNIAVHVLAGVFLFLLLQFTLELPVLRSMFRHPGLTAFFSALLWFTHPIQTQSVTYIVQRMNSMAAMFYLLSLLSYAYGRRAEKRSVKWGCFLGSALSGLLSLGSKEIAVTLPVVLFLYEWYFFQDLQPAWLKKHIPYVFGVLLFLGLSAYSYLGSNPMTAVRADYLHRDFSIIQRVFTQFPVVIYYVSLLVYPHPSRLNLDHDFPVSRSLVDPWTTLPAAATVLGLLGLAVFLAQRERLISFAILWFFGNLALESSVLGLEMVYEHRLYLPSMFFFVVVLGLAQRFVQRDWQTYAVTGTVVLLLCVWTFQRNRVWQEPVVFWNDCVSKSPRKSRPHMNLGLALADTGRIEEAVTECNKAITLAPNSAKAHNNMGNFLAAQEKREEAVKSYVRAISLDAGYAKAYNNLGVVLAEMGRLDGAIVQYLKAVEIQPDYASAHNNLGVALAETGRLEEAVEHYRTALAARPDQVDEILNNLGGALVSLGRLDEAVVRFRKVLEIRPGHVDGLNNLGSALTLQGKVREAMDYYRKAVRIQPDYAPAHASLAMAYLTLGDGQSVLREYDVVKQLDQRLARMLEKELRSRGLLQ
jgi:tetratricopeptide (TPR) repeat protein